MRESSSNWYTELLQQHTDKKEKHELSTDKQQRIATILSVYKSEFGYGEMGDGSPITDLQALGDAMFDVLHYCLANELNFEAEFNKTRDVFIWENKLKERF